MTGFRKVKLHKNMVALSDYKIILNPLHFFQMMPIRQGYYYMFNVLLSLATTDEWEDICIVPVDEDVSMAMGCADYQSLLISIGMQPPSDMVWGRSYLGTAFMSCLLLYELYMLQFMRVHLNLKKNYRPFIHHAALISYCIH